LEIHYAAYHKTNPETGEVIWNGSLIWAWYGVCEWLFRVLCFAKLISYGLQCVTGL